MAIEPQLSEVSHAGTLEESRSAFSPEFVKDARARIEVALYAAGRPLSLEELCKAARISSKRRVSQMVVELSRKVNETFLALELKQIEGELFSLQLKPSYNQTAKKFATKPLLSNAVLKTLSFIVYLQPIGATELVQRRGSQVYTHLKELLETGFITAEKRGRTRLFQTTDAFADYFGLSRDQEQQRKQVARHGLVSKADKVVELQKQEERTS